MGDLKTNTTKIRVPRMEGETRRYGTVSSPTMGEITEAMVEAGAEGMYGKNWNGPDDKRPGDQMKDVWRDLSRKALTAALSASQEGGETGTLSSPMKIRIRDLFGDHYWDSLQHERGIILQHVNAVLDLASSPPTEEKQT